MTILDKLVDVNCKKVLRKKYNEKKDLSIFRKVYGDKIEDASRTIDNALKMGGLSGGSLVVLGVVSGNPVAAAAAVVGLSVTVMDIKVQKKTLERLVEIVSGNEVAKYLLSPQDFKKYNERSQ